MEVNFRTNIKIFLDELKELKPIETATKAEFRKDKSIKAVIFDIYGTLLISSSGDIDQANLKQDNMRRALLAANFKFNPAIDADKVPEFFLAQLPFVVRKHQDELKAQGHPYPDVDIVAVWEEIIDKAYEKELLVTSKYVVLDLIIIFEILSNSVYPMPQMIEILDYLKEKNIPIGIVSNAQFYTPVIVNYFISDKLEAEQFVNGFDKDLSVFSYKELRAKPDTQLFHAFLPKMKEKYGIEAHEAIFVGNDMLKDVYTANKSGVKTVLFAGDERSLRLRENDPRVKGLKPDHTITCLSQLKEIVK